MKTYLIPAGTLGLKKFIRLSEYNAMPENERPKLAKGIGSNYIVISAHKNGGRLVGDPNLREQGLEGTFIAIEEA